MLYVLGAVIVLLMLAIVIGIYRALASTEEDRSPTNGRRGMFDGQFKMAAGSSASEKTLSGKFEVILLDTFGDNVKIKTTSVYHLNFTASTTNSWDADAERKLKSGQILMLPKSSIKWLDSNDVKYQLSDEEFRSLVKAGKVDVGDFTISLPDDWDYKKALDVVISA